MPPFRNHLGASWGWNLRTPALRIIAEAGGKIAQAPGPIFCGAVSASSPVGESVVALRLLRFFAEHAGGLQNRFSTTSLVIVFDNGVGWLTARGDWLFGSELGLSLQLM